MAEPLCLTRAGRAGAVGRTRRLGASLRHALVLGALLAAGCAGHAARTVQARRALDAHDAARALTLYNEELKVQKGSELPKTVSGDNAVLLLDRALVSQQLTAYADTSRDLESADKAVEMLDFSRSTSDEIGRYLFSDDTGPYKARPFEKLLINTMNMLSYLAQGDLAGAKIEARRLAVMQKYLGQVADDPAQALLGPGSYLAGFVFERAGEPGEALRYYDEALRFASYPSLAGPVERLSARASYSSPRLHELAAQKPTEPAYAADDADVLVVVSYGRVPALHAERVPIGLALTYAGLYMDPAREQAARRLAGQGLVTWINFPSLEGSPRSYAAPGVQLDGRVLAVDTPTDVEQLVRAAYDKAKGPIFASAITRMIARGAVGAGAGVAASKAADSGILGMVVALTAQAALTAADTPDTRSWATLPARVAVYRTRVPAGQHTVQAVVQGRTLSQRIDVGKGAFSVVAFTDLSQY
jgi:tetratricopeptide (TPR) repeat protein